MPKDADLAVVGMPVDAVMVHQEGRKEDHDAKAQNDRKNAENTRFAISCVHVQACIEQFLLILDYQFFSLAKSNGPIDIFIGRRMLHFRYSPAALFHAT
jgi:hypothetical protein